MHYVSSQDKARIDARFGYVVEFVKKAKTSSCFLCEDGDKISAVQACLQSNEGQNRHAAQAGTKTKKKLQDFLVYMDFQTETTQLITNTINKMEITRTFDIVSKNAR